MRLTLLLLLLFSSYGYSQSNPEQAAQQSNQSLPPALNNASLPPLTIFERVPSLAPSLYTDSVAQQILAKHPTTSFDSKSLFIQEDSQAVMSAAYDQYQQVRNTSFDNDLIKDKLNELSNKIDPSAMADQSAISELEEASTSPTRLLQGEVMKDSLAVSLQQRINNAPIQDRPIIKRVKETPDLKQVIVKHRPSLLDRSYGEATIGLAPQHLEMIQLVPTVGTYLTRHLSLGVGFDGLINGFKDSQAIVGLKSFIKVDLLPRKLYLQAENTSYFSDLSYWYEEAEAQRENLQVPYLGGGVLLNVFDNKSLNLSLMHRLGDHPFFQEGNSAWVFRLGMSFFPKTAQPNAFQR